MVVVVGPPDREASGLVPPSGEGRSGGSAASRMVGSLRVPAFRWYVAAEFAVWAAMGMQALATGVLVWGETGSFVALQLTAFVWAVPRAGVALVGGVLADRVPKKYLIQVAQLAAGGVALGVALLVAFDLVRFRHLLLVAFVQGTAMSLMLPARIATLPRLVGAARIQNALALSMGARSLMLILGPGIAGVMLGTLADEYLYFLISGFYFFAVAVYLKVPHVERVTEMVDDGSAASQRGWTQRDVAPGVSRHRTIEVLLGVNLAVVLLSMRYQYRLWQYLDDVVGAGRDASLLVGIAALGALVPIAVIAAMPTRHRGMILLLGMFTMGAALLGLSFATTVLLAAPIMVVISIGHAIQLLLSSVLIQTYVADAYRGRVSGLFVATISMAPLSTVFAGVMPSVGGPQMTIGSMAVMLLLLTTWLWFFAPSLRELD